MTKFKKRPFRDWLDCLAKTAVKARDKHVCQRCGCKMSFGDHNCQWAHVISRSSNNLRWHLCNALTLCGECHQFAHSHPTEYALWFVKNCTGMWNVINSPMYRLHITWKEEDYRKVEQYLLQKCKDFKVDPLSVPVKYRNKFIKAMKEFKE